MGEVTIHTSDMTAQCFRSIQLRRAGKIQGEYTTALVRGSIADGALGYIHERDKWSNNAVEDALQDAAADLLQESKTSYRPLSESVKDNWEKILAEVFKTLERYCDRQADYFQDCTLIGTQVPVRFTLDEGTDEPIHFASHLDLLYRDPEGQLIIRDWKYQDAQPDMAYLGRNGQMACYHLAIRSGWVCVAPDLDHWVQFDEHPLMEWADLMRFKPYGRAQGDFVKGDERPLKNIVRAFYIDDQAEKNICKEIRLRHLMIKHDIMPMNPDKVRCFSCDSRNWCQAYTKEAPLMM